MFFSTYNQEMFVQALLKIVCVYSGLWDLAFERSEFMTTRLLGPESMRELEARRFKIEKKFNCFFRNEKSTVPVK